MENKKSKFRVSTLILMIFCILGFVLTLQFKNTKEDYSFVSLKTINDLDNSVKIEQEEIKNLQELIRQKKKNLIEYETAIQQEGSIKDVIKSEIQSMQVITGLYDLEGPGVIVRLKDSDRELYEWEDPNDLIIHDTDLLIIINDLKSAGAEVLSINGQRVINTSEIQCTGPTITINGYTYGQPFIIKAIGDPVTLDAAIKAPSSHSAFLREGFGIMVDSQVNPRVRISRFQGNMKMDYMTPREGE